MIDTIATDICENPACEAWTAPEDMHTVRDIRVCGDCYELVVDAEYERAYG